MAYKEVNPDTWTYENDGDFIEGILVKKEEDVGANKSMLYSLEVEPSKFISVWGSTILDQRMALVNVGEKIKITYKGLGEKKPGKNPPKIFKVEIDEPEESTDKGLGKKKPGKNPPKIFKVEIDEPEESTDSSE